MVEVVGVVLNDKTKKVELQMKAWEAARCPVCGRECRNQFNLEIHRRVQKH